MSLAGRPVLVGFAESLAAIETTWLLQEAGFEVVAFTRRGRQPALARSRGVTVHPVTSPQLDASACVADIAAVAERIQACVVMPLDDDAVWLCDRLAALDGVPAIAGPTGDRAVLALDKRVQLELAAASGLAVPATTVVEAGHAAAPPDGPGPWIVKPALAVEVEGDRLLRGSGVLVEDPAEIARIASGATSPLLIQPQLRGVGEGVFGHAGPGGVVGFSAHRRVRMMNPAGSGSSACRSVDPDPELAPGVSAFLRGGDWRGLFMLEFLRSSDATPWFMELNGRPWGSMVLARHRGLNYPAWTVEQALDEAFAPASPQPGPHVVARHLGREIIHLAFVARGRPDGQDDWPRLGPTLRTVLRWRRGERWYNMRRGDVQVFLDDTWTTVTGWLTKRRARR